MIAVVQRVVSASVTVGDATVGAIDSGLLALVAVETGDGAKEIDWMAQKLTGLRVFRREDKHFDLDVLQTGGGILLVSNFTVAADTRKGRRPSLDAAAPPAHASITFEKLVAAVRATGVCTQTGTFGGEMRVHLTNDGPATFIIRTESPVDR
ncbi:MAG TPA: D-aminoacyl-tRNA deacylase [Tepidisphaeraceae bacterium]|nr:D-aminoacyl-tRNA deacylase [Tepidisphaeraceae bacterium]